ncbi:MAG: exodeoxyribonuclease V subunit gamma [Planctomycetaceae bacterium]
MPLAISYVRRLDDVLEPVCRFLSHDRDLFAKPRIVVPTAGAKAWLAATLAERLGASTGPDGACARDGIVANVDFSYPGTISTLVSDAARTEADPWDVDHLTFTILEVLARDDTFAQVVARAGGPLLAARRIADRFDHYHFRRPGMILAWEQGKPQLSPEADVAGDRIARDLPARDRWQFDLWRQVRATIGEKSPPARERDAPGPAPDAVFVAGLQGLSLQQIALLERLATLPSQAGPPCRVDVLLVHPAPALGRPWATTAPPVSQDHTATQARGSAAPTTDVDPLVDAWLRGTRESQWLLAAQGLHPEFGPAAPEALPADAPLLARLKHTVATGRVPVAAADVAFRKDDQSVRIHRCHDLGRQAEVLHDAILHAFREIPGLAPHDVVILSPQIATLAPHLEAVFNRDVTGAERGGKPAELHLPLLVADRGIREVSRGAELLAALIELAGSRCSVDGVLALATHPLVLAHFGLDDEDVEIWRRCIERTKIRWGLDAARRSRGGGLDRDDLPAHTWRLGLERTLLGAVVPDGEPEPVLGGVVPLRSVDTADIASLAPLITIVGIIDDVDRAAAEPRPVAAWCDLLEEALGQLAGAESDALAVPLRELDGLRRSAAAAAGASPAEVAVPWHDLETILAATLVAPVGRQPLRTGMITATSLIPLRGVPFRVVCLAGYDDEAVAPREGDSEDLVDRQQLLGDRDRGLEVRRELLDCLLAAEDRLVITCTGMDVRNNQMLPLVTPLAEFADFVGRHGVPTVARGDHRSSEIEIIHPRHACSRGNFLTGKESLLGTSDAWSHDAAARAAAKALGRPPATPPAAAGAGGLPAPLEAIPLEWLAEFMHDPLWPFVRKTLGISPWRDDDLSIPATLPLELERLEKRSLRDDYLERLLATRDREAFAAAWAADVTANGDVPVLGFGRAAVAEITQFSAALLDLAAAAGVPLEERRHKPISLQLDGVALTGTIERCYPDADDVRTIVLVRPDAIETSTHGFLVARALAGLQLLALEAAGPSSAQAVILSQYEGWTPGDGAATVPPDDVVQIRRIRLDDAISSTVAQQMLGELGRLYRQAVAEPRGLFGKTAEHLPNDRDEALEAFTTFTTSGRYAQSNEAVVHGGQPDFEQLFDEATPERLRSILDFHARFKALTDMTYDKSARAYVYHPHAP